MRYLFIFCLLAIGITYFYAGFQNAEAQVTTSCGVGGQAEGLISGQQISGKFGNANSVCILDSLSSYANYKVDTFDSLYNKFFTKVNASSSVQKLTLGNIDQNSLRFDGNTSFLVSAGNVRIRADTPENISGSNTAIVFVNGYLEIEKNIIYGTGTTGLIFVVKGTTYIHQSVTEINAVIVGEGRICTAYVAGVDTCLPTDVTPQLTIYGSLISLDQNPAHTRPILFGRVSEDVNVPAEIINQQAKYLVILKGLFTNNYTLQREINLAQVPNFTPPPPPPPPTPPPGPGNCLANAGVLQVITTCLLNQLNI